MADKKSINISKTKRGKFTEWCGRHGHEGVTSDCIKEGLASKLVKVRKMANFAGNARKFKH